MEAFKVLDYGVYGICVMLVGLVTKIWIDSSKKTDKMIDVVEKNAESNQGLKGAVEHLENVIDRALRGD